MMKRKVMLYVDAPQHLQIASAIIATLREDAEVRLVTTVPVPAEFELGRNGRLLAVETPALGRLPRVLRTLLKGTLVIRRLKTLARAAAGAQTLVVFNDTGIPQRYLIRLGKRLGWRTVLVQDGLTETQHRERTLAFRMKLAITSAVLSPLALGHYGTTRYGCSGIDVVLADGPLSGGFFRERTCGAHVVEAGFLRPGVGSQSQPEQAYALFWAVDFLGGLSNRRLHELQLEVIERLAGALRAADDCLVLRVRLHPGDLQHANEYAERLGAHANVQLTRSPEGPFAGGRPVAALSLQSAGVFDTLAARVPSFFVDGLDQRLAPQWTPNELLLVQSECSQLLARLRSEPALGDAIWHDQVRALKGRMRIPFDADAVRNAVC